MADKYLRTELIDTTNGPIRGIVRNGMHQFLGIPYASAPVGDLRWRPPIPPAPWAKPRDAIAYGNSCAQDFPAGHGFSAQSFEEDCLFLNVFTPVTVAQDHQNKLPVMVWIHGGGFVCGASNDYDPTKLVCAGNVVFVSLNYRLNVFGFFSHPSLNDKDQPSGNFGIMDQQLALRWVQENIELFGGDRGNTTIAGESAGGVSVMAHLASPRSTGLFHKAIVQSGGGPASMVYPSVEELEKPGVDLLLRAGCNEQDQSPAALRMISTKALLEANALPDGEFGLGKFPVKLMEDGIIIPRNLREKFAKGHFSRVPIIAGMNRDEMTWFLALRELTTGRITSRKDYNNVIAQTFTNSFPAFFIPGRVPAEKISEILNFYPVNGGSDGDATRALAAAIGDAGMVSTAGRRSIRVLSQYVQVFGYEFDVPDSPSPWPSASFPLDSGHTLELQYLFPCFRGGSGTAKSLNGPQLQLSEHMVKFWTAFVKSGCPNAEHPSEPTWKPYDALEDNVMLLHSPVPSMIQAWGHRHHSDFWDQFYV